MNTMGTLVMKFFNNYLANERGVSLNTIRSYSDCVRLMLDYTAMRLGLTPDKLSFDAISDTLILECVLSATVRESRCGCLID